MHALAPAAEYLPGPQFKQENDVLVGTKYEPAEQGTAHEAEANAAYWPIGQAQQALAPTTAYVSVPQAEHVEDDTAFVELE